MKFRLRRALAERAKHFSSRTMTLNVALLKVVYDAFTVCNVIFAMSSTDCVKMHELSHSVDSRVSARLK